MVNFIRPHRVTYYRVFMACVILASPRCSRMSSRKAHWGPPALDVGTLTVTEHRSTTKLMVVKHALLRIPDLSKYSLILKICDTQL
jgi:hypothetical protein